MFVSLDVEGTDTLEAYLGDAGIFLDMMVAQSSTGELDGPKTRHVVDLLRKPFRS